MPLICPKCKGGLVTNEVSYSCENCNLVFPVVCDIPDFRLRPDRYLSWKDERDKANRLDTYAKTHSFEQLINYYYSITDDVSPEFARRYAEYALAGPSRGRSILEACGAYRDRGRILDIGCGAGGLLVAAAQCGLTVVGVDIALRWLVIAKKHMETEGLAVGLICADAEAMPFADQTFRCVVAADVLDHTREPKQLVCEAARVTRSRGNIWFSAGNRYWIGPHPAVGLWAAGLMPSALRSALLFRLRGVDTLRHAGFISAPGLVRIARRAGLKVEDLAPRELAPPKPSVSTLRAVVQWLYIYSCRLPGLRHMLILAGPAFQMVVSAPQKEEFR